MIDVLIAPGRGADAVARCVARLAQARSSAAFEVKVCGDAPALEAASRGGRDVAIVDAATWVPDGWLDRLAACARREPRVATASAFCNDAARCGYPRYAGPNALPQGLTAQALDALFAAANSGEGIDIPAPETACVFIAREALSAAGPLDAGFAERAAGAGFRHLACADLYVHRDAVEARADAAEHEALRPFRRRVDLARLAASPRPHVLMVTHAWGGGVERHVEDLARVVAADAEVLRLRPDALGTVEVRWLRAGEEFAAWLAAAHWDTAIELLRAARIDRVHFHHVHKLPREALDLPAALGVPYDVTLHDYYPVCPRYHLMPAAGGSCADDALPCSRCGEPAQWGLDLAGWRTLFHGFLRGAARVIAPSGDVARRIRGYFPDVAILEWPHAEFAAPLPDVRKVALLGGISALKGARQLEASVADAQSRQLPLHFHVVGHVDRPMASFPAAPLTIGGSYDEAALGRLLVLERPDAFLFLSQVPETYSYTLTAAMRTGLPIVATRIGAFPERLRDYPRHALVERDAAAAVVNDALLSCTGAPRPFAAHGGDGGATAPEDYRRRIVAPYAPAARAAAAIPALSPALWFAPVRPEPPVSLRDLYDAGVRAGHAETRAYLENRVDAFDDALDRSRQALAHTRKELTGVQAELGEARRVFDRHERELQAARDAARARIAELEGSAFWRLTYPMRVTVHAGKVTVRRLRTLPRRLRMLKPRLATARAIAKDQGVAELVRRVAGKAQRRVRPAGLRSRAALEKAIRPLHLPSSESPLVSVIVPTYGQDLHTFSCLVALAAEAAAVSLEVLVMDDCAPTPAAAALAPVTGVRFERNATNLGFIGNCNRGASLARGEYLLFLNNDAIVGAGTLDALLDVFARDPQAGGAGAKLVYPDGRLQEAGAIVWRDGTAWNWGRGDDPDKPEYNYLRVADYCSAACLMVPRALFESVGRFDERYAPAYCEDTDLCFKLRAAGHPVYYQPAAEAVHFEGVSHGTDTGAGVKSHQVDNQVRFRERWKDTLAAHRANGVLPRLEVDRAARRRVLFVEACMLTPDQDAGSLRTWRLMALMREAGCKVTFLAANLELREPYVSQLRQEGVEVLHAPFVRSVDEVLRDRGDEFDIVILARYYIAAPHIDAVRRYAPRALLVFDTVDLHFLRNRRLARLEGSDALAQSAEAIYREEVDCLRRCDVTWVVSDVERDIVSREAPRATVLVQSTIHDPEGDPAPWAEREGLLFVGGFRHPPNVDAAMFLVREIVPRLRARLPGVTTYIVGSNAPKAVKDLEGEGVSAVGFVPQIEPWLRRCRVSVSPLRYGAGMKGKVNQAMAHGLPVVATTMSVEGMHVVPGDEVLVADDADAFADAVARVYNDEALWNALSRAGRANVERHFSSRVARRQLGELLALADLRVT